jgi:hypothetical protein
MLVSRIPRTVNESFEQGTALAAKLREAEGTDERRSYWVSDYQSGVFAWEHYDHEGYRDYLLQQMGGRPFKSHYGPPVDRIREKIDSSPLDHFEQLYRDLHCIRVQCRTASPAHPEPAGRSAARSYEPPHHRACRTGIFPGQSYHPEAAPFRYIQGTGSGI